MAMFCFVVLDLIGLECGGVLLCCVGLECGIVV